MRWIATNLALFVAVEVAYTAVLAGAAGAPVEIAATTFAVGALLTAPLLPLYLIAVAALPRGWTRRRRRAAAVATSPLLVTFFVVAAFGGGVGTFLLVVALPGACVYGAVVRLPAASAPPAQGDVGGGA